jgi:CheY-like chemotaxis protein
VSVRIPRGLSLLLIEDDVALATVMRHWARWVDVAMDAVSLGADALDLVAQRAYDVVLLDLTLPDMEGWDLFKRMTALQPVLASRVIVLTGGAITEPSKEFLLQTRCAVLLKPFDLEALGRQLVSVKYSAA